MNELVSVIVPTIGRPQYLSKTVYTILQQSYKNIEILISDNLCETPSHFILGDIVDSRIRFVNRNSRLDFSEHMNLCISEANGSFIMILSDDDMISPNYVESMVEMFAKDPQVVVGIGRQIILDEMSFTISDAEKTPETLILPGVEYMLAHFKGKQPIPIYTYLSLFAKKVDIIEVGGFRSYPDGSYADNFLFYSLALKGRVGLSNVVMGYRVYTTSTGLSTPFTRLIDATCAYYLDMSILIARIPSYSTAAHWKLRLSILTSLARMVLYRLIKIYSPRDGLKVTIANFFTLIMRLVRGCGRSSFI